MDPVLADVITLLELERLEDNIFRGESRDIGSPQVFGGQVLGQALSAASRTVERRSPHSFHAYFLRRGDYRAPIVYDVDRLRDDRSFTTRRVVAIQHGEPIFNMAASFQVEEKGLDHQVPMPSVPGPEGLSSIVDIKKTILEQVPDKMRRYLTHKAPFEFRPVQPPNFLKPEKLNPCKHMWMRACGRLPDDPDLHRNLLAYVADYELLATATLPHGLRFDVENVQMASLDHAMWFHRSARVDQWLLYALDSPSASGARGFARGQVFTQQGELIASTHQEGMIRILDKDQAGIANETATGL